MNLQEAFDSLLKRQLITFTDFELYEHIKKETGSEILGLLALIVNFALRRGDSCIDLNKVANKDICEILECEEDLGKYSLPNLVKLKKEIKSIKEPLKNNLFFLYDDKLLFFKRIYDYEKRIAGLLKKLSDKAKPPNVDDIECDECDFWQRFAVSIAATNNLLIISGGPGTGKTTAIKNIVQNLKSKKIGLCAPTGKAVSRMIESLKGLDMQEGLEKPMTLHRLLKSNEKLTRFFYNEDNRLPYDVVIVDEASMVNLEMAYRLLISLKDDSRLIIIGDKDQLTSVETGSFLSEICSFKDKLNVKNLNVFLKDFIQNVDEKCKKVAVLSDEIKKPIIDCSVELVKNFRFDEKSGIGELSKAIRENNINAVRDIVENNSYDDLIFEDSLNKQVMNRIIKEYEKAIEKNTEESFKAVKILTPLRVSNTGSIKLNEIVDRDLKKRLGTYGQWYKGREVIINVNDYQNNLFNGDIGVCIKKDDRTTISFSKSTDGYIAILPKLLPSYELAFAMTVHKSQGSEFDNVYFILGTQVKYLTKELIYTAITRARKKVCIIGDRQILKKALQLSSKRQSALGDMLYKDI